MFLYKYDLVNVRLTTTNKQLYNIFFEEKKTEINFRKLYLFILFLKNLQEVAMKDTPSRIPTSKTFLLLFIGKSLQFLNGLHLLIKPVDDVIEHF